MADPEEGSDGPFDPMLSDDFSVDSTVCVGDEIETKDLTLNRDWIIYSSLVTGYINSVPTSNICGLSLLSIQEMPTPREHEFNISKKITNETGL